VRFEVFCPQEDAPREVEEVEDYISSSEDVLWSIRPIYHE